MLYDMVVFGLADIANITVAYHGNPDFPTSGKANMTGFEAKYPPSLLQLSIKPVTSLFLLPVSAAADFLLGLQALTHFLTVQELTFGIFDMSSGDSNLIATGCLAFDCSASGQVSSELGQGSSVISKESTTDKVALPPGMQVGPLNSSRLVEDSELGLKVLYTSVSQANPILVGHFTDLASDVIWQIVGAIIASKGDVLMPDWGLRDDPKLGYQYGLYSKDPWGSGLLVLVGQDYGAVENLTLGLVAGVMKLTMILLNIQFFVESNLNILINNRTQIDSQMGDVACFGYNGDGACPQIDDARDGNSSVISTGGNPAFPLTLPTSSSSATSALKPRSESSS